MRLTASGVTCQRIYPAGAPVFSISTSEAQTACIKIHTTPVEAVRAKAGRNKALTAAIIDSQSVKTAAQKGIRGYDVGKKIKGRKRHMLLDTMGSILLLDVHLLVIQGREGVAELLKQLIQFYGWLKRIRADGGYSGP